MFVCFINRAHSLTTATAKAPAPAPAPAPTLTFAPSSAAYSAVTPSTTLTSTSALTLRLTPASLFCSLLGSLSCSIPCVLVCEAKVSWLIHNTHATAWQSPASCSNLRQLLAFFPASFLHAILFSGLLAGCCVFNWLLHALAAINKPAAWYARNMQHAVANDLLHAPPAVSTVSLSALSCNFLLWPPTTNNNLVSQMQTLMTKC